MKKVDKVETIQKKPRLSWSKTVEKDGWTTTTRVEKLDNTGFLVSINIYGSNKKGVYKDVSRKVYSETNPLEEEEQNDPLKTLFDSIK